MEPQVAECQERLIEEIQTLSVRQMRSLLDFVQELKCGPTEQTLLAMVGRSGVTADDIEDTCGRLRRSRLVTPRLLSALRALAAANAPLAEEERLSTLLEKNREAAIADTEREELDRLVTAGDRMNLTKAGALVALKALTGGLPPPARRKR